MKGTIGRLVGVSLVVLLIATLVASVYTGSQGSELKRFSSVTELKEFLKSASSGEAFGYSLGTKTAIAGAAQTGAPNGESTQSADYSRTNIQVEGVDEADIVKSDGKYIYVLSSNNVSIIDAYPTDGARIVSTLGFDGYPTEMFVNKDKLIVFGQIYGNYYGVMEKGTSEGSIGILPPVYYTPKAFIHVYDISDKSSPKLERNVSVDGNYVDSRMIGDYVYVVANEAAYDANPMPLPVVYADGETRTVAATDIYYFDVPDYSYAYTNIVAINSQDKSQDISMKTFLMGYTQNIYVSSENMYITYTKRLSYADYYDRIIRDAILPSVPSDVQANINQILNSNMKAYEKMEEVQKALQEHIDALMPEDAAKVMKDIETRAQAVYEEITKEMEKTVIHKIGLDNGSIEYKSKGEVPGYALNQFSMDEANGYFRIATTTQNWRTTSLNHLYVLDGELSIVGRLEDLAKGERIYSTRFIGDKAYMVTFRQIDPLFVIDLSNPTSPSVLGFLKITGVSDYLHPYDETHVIGVGRDATEEGRIKGMKLSLFDVSDVSNPTEVSTYFIGERGTDSEALYDHKAFLFSKDKNLLVIPVRLAEGDKWNVWNGAYVFSLSLDDGFVLKGKVTHANSTSEYYYDYLTEVRRSLYIDDVLYTISSKVVKMNNLDSMEEIGKIDLPSDAYLTPLYVSDSSKTSS
jgi:uncharacterized secreted protein with C-terminal beta-propeller domain